MLPLPCPTPGMDHSKISVWRGGLGSGETSSERGKWQQCPGMPPTGAVLTFLQLAVLQVTFLLWITGVNRTHLGLGCCRRERHLHESCRGAAISAKLPAHTDGRVGHLPFFSIYVPLLPSPLPGLALGRLRFGDWGCTRLSSSSLFKAGGICSPVRQVP